jgi:hypothetical protein
MNKVKSIKLPIVRRVKLENFIKRLDGKIFTVEFTKQDGTKRVMNARTRVTQYIKKAPKRKVTPNGVHTSSIKVYDMQKRAYRQINLETVTKITAVGKTFMVI